MQNSPVRSSHRIMVVDDDNVGRYLCRAMFRKLGFEVLAVESGVDAIAILRNEHFDLLLLDLMMPEMDGIKVASIIRGRNEFIVNCNIVIIALTASSLEHDRARCEMAGFNDYLVKPLLMGTLEFIVSKWLV